MILYTFNQNFDQPSKQSFSNSLPSKSLRSSRISRSLSLITFPLDAFISLRDTNVILRASNTQPLLIVVSYISQTLEPVGAQDDALPLRAPGFKHLNQLIQIDAALCLFELCPSAFEFICRVKLVRTLNHYSSQSCRQLSPVVNYRQFQWIEAVSTLMHYCRVCSGATLYVSVSKV